MGRPLFSKSYSAPAVRTEPEPAPPAIPYEKWSRWNSFDPDSDEFFDRDDAVYEAFIDPSEITPLGEREAEVLVDPLISRERSESPASSEGTISGRGSPMAVGSDDPASLIADAYRVDEFEPRLRGQNEIHTFDMDSVNAMSGMNTPPVPEFTDAPAIYDQTFDLTRHSHISHVVYTSNGSTHPAQIRVSITPISDSNVGSIPPSSPPAVDRPTTPLPNHDITYDQTALSPPPIVTPRLYAWSSHSPFPPHSPTPSLLQRRTGPLTNPNARMSLAHLSPASVRVRMA